MLDAYIIDDIKRRDDERRRDEAARPRLRIEIEEGPAPPDADEGDDQLDSDDVIQIPL